MTDGSYNRTSNGTNAAHNGATNGATHRLTVIVSSPAQHPNAQRRIAIVGTGYVGLVTGRCLAEFGNSVVCLDNDASKIATLRRGELPFFEPQLLEMMVANHRAGRLSFSEDVEGGVRDAAIVFIAVGRPPCHDSRRRFICHLGRRCDDWSRRRTEDVVVKSTVPVETSEMVATTIGENAVRRHRVDVVSNPEFLREGSAVADFMHPTAS